MLPSESYSHYFTHKSQQSSDARIWKAYALSFCMEDVIQGGWRSFGDPRQNYWPTFLCTPNSCYHTKATLTAFSTKSQQSSDAQKQTYNLCPVLQYGKNNLWRRKDCFESPEQNYQAIFSFALDSCYHSKALATKYITV